MDPAKRLVTEMILDPLELGSRAKSLMLSAATAPMDERKWSDLQKKGFLMKVAEQVARQVRLDSASLDQLLRQILQGRIRDQQVLLDLASTSSLEIENNGSSPGAKGASSVEAMNRLKQHFWCVITVTGEQVGPPYVTVDAVDMAIGNSGFTQRLQRQRLTYVQVARNNHRDFQVVAGFLAERRDMQAELRRTGLKITNPPR